MGKIPRFEQQQLASQAVGTPGAGQADDSAVGMFNAIAQAAGGVQGQAIAQLRQEQLMAQRAALAKQREQAALARVQQKALDDAELAKHQYAIDKDLDEKRNAIQQEPTYINQPKAAPTAYEGVGRQSIEQYAESIQDPVMRARVTKAGFGSLKASMGRVQDWATTQQIGNVKADFEHMLADHAIELGNANTPEELLQKSAEFSQSRLGVYSDLLGKEQVDKAYRDAREKGIVNQLARLVDSPNPEIAQQIIDSGVYKDLVDQTNVKQTFAALRADARRMESEQRLREHLTQQSNRVGFWTEANAISGGNVNNLTTKDAEELKNKYPDLPVPDLIAAQKNVAAAQEREYQKMRDDQLVRHMAAQIPGTNKLVESIETAYYRVQSTKGEQQKTAVRELDRLVDSYTDRIRQIEQITATVKDPTAKAMLETEADKIRKISSGVSQVFRKFPKTVSEQNVKQAKFNQIMSPAKVYGNNPAAAAVYNHHYSVHVRNRYAEIERTGKLDQFLASPKLQQMLRREASDKAVREADKVMQPKRLQ